jgi:hypothetical protein
MQPVDFVGYLASGLVVSAFYMKDMASLRVAALASNCAFLAYGMGLHLGPVIVLHALLLPLNVWRLSQVLRGGTCLSASIRRSSSLRDAP